MRDEILNSRLFELLRIPTICLIFDILAEILFTYLLFKSNFTKIHKRENFYFFFRRKVRQCHNIIRSFITHWYCWGSSVFFIIACCFRMCFYLDLINKLELFCRVIFLMILQKLTRGKGFFVLLQFLLYLTLFKMLEKLLILVGKNQHYLNFIGNILFLYISFIRV